MEDLAQAVQDAKYQSAVTSTTPQPLRALPIALDVARARVDLAALDRDWLSFARLLSEPLGFWILTRFFRSLGLGRVIDFIDSATVYKGNPVPAERLALAQRMRRRGAPLHEVDQLLEEALRQRERAEKAIGVDPFERRCATLQSPSADAFVQALADVSVAGALDRGGADTIDDALGIGTLIPHFLLREVDGEIAAAAADLHALCAQADVRTAYNGERRRRGLLSAASLGLRRTLWDRTANFLVGGVLRDAFLGIAAAGTGTSADGDASASAAGSGGAGAGGGFHGSALETEYIQLRAFEVSPVERRCVSSFLLFHFFCLLISSFVCSYSFCLLFVERSHFVRFRTLGRGGFGDVTGCKAVHTGKMFALKRVRKVRREEMCWAERAVLARCGSPFVARLRYTFQSVAHAYFVLDLMVGGSLDFHLRRVRRVRRSGRRSDGAAGRGARSAGRSGGGGATGGLHENEARFYMAEIVLGLEALHRLGWVFRDLKPANVLLDAAGHVRIADMGLATPFREPAEGESDAVGPRTLWVRRTLRGRSGTAGYIAPEVVQQHSALAQGQGFGAECDFWALGAVLAELLDGANPYRVRAAEEQRAASAAPFAASASARANAATKRQRARDRTLAIDRAVLTCAVEIEGAGAEAQALCAALLEHDPELRLGHVADGALRQRGGGVVDSDPRWVAGFDALKRDAWFASVDWDVAAAQRLVPPLRPGRGINAANIEEFDGTGRATRASDGGSGGGGGGGGGGGVTMFEGWGFRSRIGVQEEIVNFVEATGGSLARSQQRWAWGGAGGLLRADGGVRDARDEHDACGGDVCALS